MSEFKLHDSIDTETLRLSELYNETIDGTEAWIDAVDIENTEMSGIKAFNGVLCWWNGTYIGYCEDTEENRKSIGIMWDEVNTIKP